MMFGPHDECDVEKCCREKWTPEDEWLCIHDHTGCPYNDGHNGCGYEGESLHPLEEGSE